MSVSSLGFLPGYGPAPPLPIRSGQRALPMTPPEIRSKRKAAYDYSTLFKINSKGQVTQAQIPVSGIRIYKGKDGKKKVHVQSPGKGQSFTATQGCKKKYKKKSKKSKE